MNKLVIISGLAIVLMSSCATQKIVSYNDDMYANPTEDKKEEARIAAIRKKQQDIADKRYSDSLSNVRLAQKAKDDANPAYKDREFKYDDYYDYEYATRVKRFNNNINGLSYYDNYYTNSYWYNQNPYSYGVSVYNGYSWWGNSYNSYSYNPQANFYNSYGWNSYPSYGYNGYNPYCYNNSYGYGYYNGYNNGYYNGYNNGWNNYPYGYGNSYGYGGYGYNPYGYSGYNPYGGYYGNYYGNGYNNSSWGYYNSYDNNSQYTYGPRESHGGGNSHRTSGAGMTTNSTADNNYYNRYVSSVNDHQKQITKFEALPQVKVTNENNPIRVDSRGNVMENTNNIKTSVIYDNNGNTNPTRGYQGTHKSESNADVYSTPTNSNPNENTNGNNGVRNNNNSYHQQQNNNTYEQQPVNNSNNNNFDTKPTRNQYENKPIETKPTYQEPVRNNNYQNNTPTPNYNNGGGGGSSPRNSGGGGGGGGRPR